MTRTKQDKAKQLTGLQALITGTRKHFPSGTLTIGNATITPDALVQVLQSLIDGMIKQNAAQQSAKDALTELRNQKQRASPLIKGFRQLLLAMFGDAGQTLADFGLTPRKARSPLTVEKKAAAKAQAKATRDARGTKGPKAKLAIKGTVAPAHPAPQPTTPMKPS